MFKEPKERAGRVRKDLLKYYTKPHRYVVGIDAGVNTGFSVWDKSEKKFIRVDTLPIHEAMYLVATLKEISNGEGFKVRVEDARLRKWIPRQANEKAERGRAAGAGSVKRDAQIWEQYLTHLKVDFEMVAPKNNKTKVNADYFKKLTGWEGKTNEHGRDAGMLCFGF